MTTSTIKVLDLYKRLFKYGQQLKYTDKTYYYQYIRKQFESVDRENIQKIETLYQKGEAFLSKQRLV